MYKYTTFISKWLYNSNFSLSRFSQLLQFVLSFNRYSSLSNSKTRFDIQSCLNQLSRTINRTDYSLSAYFTPPKIRLMKPHPASIRYAFCVRYHAMRRTHLLVFSSRWMWIFVYLFQTHNNIDRECTMWRENYRPLVGHSWATMRIDRWVVRCILLYFG